MLVIPGTAKWDENTGFHCRLFIGRIPSSQTSQTFDKSHDLMERIQPLSSIKNCSIWLFAKNQIHKYSTLFNSRTSGWKISSEMVRESVSQVYHFSSIYTCYCPICTHCNYQKVIILFSSNKRPELIRPVMNDSSSFWIFEFIPGSQWSVTYNSDKNGYIFGFHRTMELRISL